MVIGSCKGLVKILSVIHTEYLCSFQSYLGVSCQFILLILKYNLIAWIYLSMQYELSTPNFTEFVKNIKTVSNSLLHNIRYSLNIYNYGGLTRDLLDACRDITYRYVLIVKILMNFFWGGGWILSKSKYITNIHASFIRFNVSLTHEQLKAKEDAIEIFSVF